MLNLCEQQCATGLGPREHLPRLSSTVSRQFNNFGSTDGV